MSVFAKPGSKDTAIAGVDNEAVHVRVAAPPVDGEANKELLRFIAKLLSLRSSDVDLDRVKKQYLCNNTMRFFLLIQFLIIYENTKGNKNRNKTLILSNCSLSVDDLLARFRKEASDS